MTRTIFHELGSGYRQPLVQFDASDPKPAYNVRLRTALNDSGQLSLTFPSTNKEAQNLSQMVSEVTICEADDDIWRGRVTDISFDNFGNIVVTVKGLLDYLYDTTIPPTTLSGTAQQVLSGLIAIHNAKGISDNKQFSVGTVDIPGTVEIEVAQHTKAWDVIKTLLSKYKGYISSYRGSDGANIIDWVADIDRVCSQVITPGKNQVKLSDERSASAICTVLYGYGKRTGDTQVSFSTVNNGLDYVVDDDALGEFGWIEDTYINNDCESPQQLLEETQAELTQRLSDIRTISVQTIDLADLYSDVERFRVGYLGHVFVQSRGIDATIPIKSIDWYPYEPGKTQITLGASIKLISKIKSGG